MPRRRASNNQPLTAAGARQAIADKMIEAELQANVRSSALANGWLFYHTHRSDRSDEGFPDCVMVRIVGFKREALFVELKREKKNPTDAQEKWLSAFSHFPDIASYVWRPMDWLDGTIQKRLSR